MKTEVTTRHFDISESLKKRTEERLNKLHRFFDRILDARVVVSFEKNRYDAEATLIANGTPITSHLFHETSAHLMSATPGSVWCEHMPWWEPVLKAPAAFRNGHIVLGDTPGIGAEWDEEACRKFAPTPGGD